MYGLPFQANGFLSKSVFADYGKGFIKTKRLSPDGFLQVMMTSHLTVTLYFMHTVASTLAKDLLVFILQK